MLGIGLILALLAVSFIGHNMSMVYSCLILLALRFLLPHSALEYVAGHGINWGVIILTVAILVPIIDGRIGPAEMKASLSGGVAILALFIGLLVALLGRWGIAMMTTDPQITLTLMIGTVLGVIFFKGVAVGPLIAGGYNLCDPDRLEDAGIHGFLRKEVLNMNKQNRFFRHKGLAGALAMVAVILAVAFAAGYHLPDAAAKKGKETAALTETQKQMPQKAPEPAISPEKAKEADRKESISLDASKATIL